MGIHWVRADNYEAMCRQGAAHMMAVIESQRAKGQPMRLGLATGNTMLGLYERLAAMLNERRLDLSGLHTFNLDEYVGADGQWAPLDHPLSYRAYMEHHFFGRIDPRLGLIRGQVHFPDPRQPEAFDALIDKLGGLDLQLLGIGFNGHVGFNEPMLEADVAPETFASLPSRVIDLTELTIANNACLTAQGDRAAVPRRAVTLGMASILASRDILLLACFSEQSKPLERIRTGRPTPELPASYLLGHPNATIVYAGDQVSLNEDV